MRVWANNERFEPAFSYWRERRRITFLLAKLDQKLEWGKLWDHCTHQWNMMLKRHTDAYDPERDQEFLRDRKAENKMKMLIVKNPQLHQALLTLHQLLGYNLPPWLPKRISRKTLHERICHER